jgi:hypothetical protein
MTKRRRSRKKVHPEAGGLTHPQRATLTPDKSRAITGFGLSRTYDLLRRGVMPAIVIGHRFYIPHTALLRWLDACGERKKTA